MTQKVSKFTRNQSLIIVTFAYVISLLIGYLSLHFLQQEQLLMQLFWADTIATVVVFLFSLVYSNSSIYDPYWSVIPPFIALFWIWMAPEKANLFRQIVVLSLISLWAIRLTANWVRGWKGLEHEDWRYQNIAAKTGKLYWPVSFLGIHYFPTIMVYLGCLPLFYTMQSANPFGAWDVLAMAVTLGAIVIETVADEQLKKFKRKNKEGLMQSGVWAYSRHPNYFGEIAFWMGIFLFVFATGYRESWWTVIGFVTMLLLFTFISVPMMDKRHREKRPEYAGYMKRVSAIIPFIPRK